MGGGVGLSIYGDYRVATGCPPIYLNILNPNSALLLLDTPQMDYLDGLSSSRKVELFSRPQPL